MNPMACLLVVLSFLGTSAWAEEGAVGQKPTAVVYKSPYCGCCKGYASHLEENGYTVQTVHIEDMSTIKRQLGVPEKLESCHTSIIGGYVVEGHVPLEALDKFMAGKPKVRGLALPGMPSGVPGMPGPKEKLTFYTIEKEPQVINLE